MINLIDEYFVLKSNLKKCEKEVKKIDNLLESDLFFEARRELEKLQLLGEKVANNARGLSISYAPTPFLKDKVKSNVVHAQGVKIIVNTDCVYVEFPFILNKKEEGDPKFIKDTLNFALEMYFYDESNFSKTFDEEMVIVYEHCYKKGYVSFRDHDNIDVNMVTDILSSCFLKDDSPMFLSHYYFSNFESDFNKTKVYLIKKIDFADFIRNGGVGLGR